ncbi:putative glutathione S transferase [Nemania serpens]|nr:putative glutathione S transferase [Nemania serpens]
MAEETTPKPSYTLHVYYTRYSSWGARPQLVLEYFQIPHETKYYSLTLPSLKPPAELSILPVLDVTPSTAVGTAAGEEEETPLRIFDSLAICEFLAEQHPEKHLWPADAHLRATARAAAAAMHSGFAALRNAYPSNFVARFTGPGIPFDEAIAKDVSKLLALWSRLRAAAKKRLAVLGQEDEGFLCGGFSIADAFFWPVLWRFRSYDVPLTGAGEDALKWMETMWNHPVMKALGREYFRQEASSQSHMAVYDNVFSEKPDVTRGKFTEDWVFESKAI